MTIWECNDNIFVIADYDPAPMIFIMKSLLQDTGMRSSTYHSSIYRGAYAAIFAGTYMLLAAYRLSGDDSGSDSNAGVWRLLLGLALVCVTGAAVGPALHRRLFKRAAPQRSLHKSRTKPHKKHSGE